MGKKSQAAKRSPAPLAPPPFLKSRRKARQVTTLFHKYTRQRDQAVQDGDSAEVEKIDQLIEEIGGRQEYQRASQVSTSFYSTSKWVLGFLARNGWLYGTQSTARVDDDAARPRKASRRPTRLLEVGAINTELLDAAALRNTLPSTELNPRTGSSLKYNLNVRAIDLHSMSDGIEEADFLTIPVPSRDPASRYDVIVCSMVLNCVTTPEQRGEMLARLFHFLRPGGLCFLTLPKSCLTLSPYMDRSSFQELLKAVHFEILETKETPKISFFICSKPEKLPNTDKPVDSRWTDKRPLHKGKKYRNDFAVTLNQTCVAGDNLKYSDDS